MKNKKSAYFPTAFFAGGFLSALTLLILAYASINPSQTQGSILVYHPENGTVSEMPVFFKKPWQEENRRDGEKMESENNIGMSWFEKKTNSDQKSGNEWSENNKFLRPEISSENEWEDDDDDDEEDEDEEDEDRGENEFEGNTIYNEIKEINENEKDLLEELQDKMPGTTEYEEIRKELLEIRDQKQKLYSELMSLRQQRQPMNNWGGKSKFEMIRQKALERKTIMEKCRQLPPNEIGKCLSENLGKQKVRQSYNDFGKFEDMPQQNPIPQPMQNTWGQGASSLKDILENCKADPANMKECLKKAIEAEKARIIEEAHRRADELSKQFESVNSSERTSSCMVKCENGVCVSEGDCGNQKNNNGNFPNSQYLPNGEKMPQSGDEWRKYNEKYNSVPTI